MPSRLPPPPDRRSHDLHGGAGQWLFYYFSTVFAPAPLPLYMAEVGISKVRALG